MARRPKKKGVISLPVGRISLVLSSHGVCVCARARNGPKTSYFASFKCN